MDPQHPPPYRVLELYSGIGGMHYAMLMAVGAQRTKVVCSVDISPLSNTVYKYNFPETNHVETGIEAFTAKKLDKLNFNVLLMSPPCQPFTRQGLKKDVEDPRSKSFLHLMSILPQMTSPPKYILLENVHGFQSSRSHQLFTEMLDQLEYTWQGFLLSPKQFGIPNSRLRYFIIAEHKPSSTPKWKSESDQEILEHFPHHKDEDIIPKCIKEFLEAPDDLEDDLKVPAKLLERYLPVMDIVTPECRNSTCFTKAYGNYCEGTGSFLHLNAGNEAPKCGEGDKPTDPDLRYLSPREVANLMAFPREHFNFPPGMTRKQKYRLLGNSLNVFVVSSLLSLLFDLDKSDDSWVL